MTISNKLTIGRILLIPIMILILFIKPLQVDMNFIGLSVAEFIFAVLFVLGSITDFLDGYLARKRNEITDFGKFLDPIADKLLTLTGLLYIVQYRTEHSFWWVLILVIVAREFIVSAIRMIAASKNSVIAASVYGKIKTVVTLVTIILILFNNFGLYLLIGDVAVIFTDILFYISVAITFLSGLDYVLKNKEVFSQIK